MNKKFFGIVGMLAVASSLGMFLAGNNSTHLMELKNYWLIPLPIALICFLVATKRSTNR